jgi:hypothetical protein
MTGTFDQFLLVAQLYANQGANRMSGPKNVRQLAGPGIAGMEGDTPLWHYDIDVADIPTLLSDPSKFFAGTEIAKSLAARVDTHEVTFVGGNEGVKTGTTVKCCYISGSQSICHSHTA